MASRTRPATHRQLLKHPTATTIRPGHSWRVINTAEAPAGHGNGTYANSQTMPRTIATTTSTAPIRATYATARTRQPG
jgi:hypothetical protein